MCAALPMTYSRCGTNIIQAPAGPPTHVLPFRLPEETGTNLYHRRWLGLFSVQIVSLPTLCRAGITPPLRVGGVGLPRVTHTSRASVEFRAISVQSAFSDRLLPRLTMSKHGRPHIKERCHYCASARRHPSVSRHSSRRSPYVFAGLPSGAGGQPLTSWPDAPFDLTSKHSA